MQDPVRPAEERDIPALLSLLVQVNRVHSEGRPDLFKPETKYSAEDLRAVIANPETPVFVYEDETSRVLGHGFCVLQRPDNTRLLQDVLTLYIDDICVDEGARGRHVGKALFDHIRSFAVEKGCHNITLNVWSCNPGARAFYEKLGLVPYKTGMEILL